MTPSVAVTIAIAASAHFHSQHAMAEEVQAETRGMTETPWNAHHACHAVP